MMGLRVAMGVMWMCSLLLGRAVWSSSLEVISPDIHTVASGVPVPDMELNGNRNRAAEPAPLTDVHGNELSPAVAEYSVDNRGDLYELHSPETDVPNLSDPSL
jgi:hypothetical protein